MRNLIAELQQVDSSHLYDVWVPGDVAATLRPMAPNFSVIPTDAGAYTLSEQIGFLRALRRRHYDLVHFAMQQQPVLYFRTRVSTFHDLTIVHHATTNSRALVGVLFRLVATAMFAVTLRSSRMVIVPSEATRHAVMQFARLPKSKTAVTLEAADVTSSDTSPFPVEFPRFLLYVGNFYEYKNVRRLVEAHQRLLVEDPDLGLVLVGRMHRAAQPLVEEIKRSGARNILFTGYIEESHRNWLYRNCHAYVFPSLSEGFGLPGLEAMSFGAPVIAARASSLPEVYRDGAAYFDPLDVDDMVSTISGVIASEDVRTDLRNRGREVLATYSWRKTAEETLAVYDSVLRAL